jgi:two-component system, LytTR family, sensor kinase
MSVAMRWFLTCLTAWTALAVLLTVWDVVAVLYEGHRPAWGDFGVTLVQMYTLGSFTPAFILIARAFPPSRRPTALTLLVYFTVIVAVCLVAEPLLILISNEFLGKRYTFKDALEGALFDFLIYTFALTIVLAVNQVQVTNDRTARALRLEGDLTKLRLESLQRQLHPHFVFNSLNAVGAIMQSDVNAAEEMLAALAALLRVATERSDRQLVPLGEELSLLDHFVLIMKMRYGERLAVRISAEPKTLEVSVPTFTLQPLVENAIVHGLEKTGGKIQVDVSCRLRDDTLQIDVADDGATPNVLALREGIGIGNTRARLAELYRGRATLSIAPREVVGTQLTLLIPALGTSQ